MHAKKNAVLGFVVFMGMSVCSSVRSASASCLQSDTASQTSASSQTRVIGTVKAVTGDRITLAADSGPEVSVAVREATRILRVAPGQKDLTNATPISLQNVHEGDRILVRGNASAGGVLQATSIILMQQLDIAAKHQRERRGLAEARRGRIGQRGGSSRGHGYDFDGRLWARRKMSWSGFPAPPSFAAMRRTR